VGPWAIETQLPARSLATPLLFTIFKWHFAAARQAGLLATVLLLFSCRPARQSTKYPEYGGSSDEADCARDDQAPAHCPSGFCRSSPTRDDGPQSVASGSRRRRNTRPPARAPTPGLAASASASFDIRTAFVTSCTLVPAAAERATIRGTQIARAFRARTRGAAASAWVFCSLSSSSIFPQTAS